ncbi:hypothetical protein RRG08_052162 [Elysia crispata]|uniref:Uncharacterized protein n=1 Tax=Elysia crispata TaxID=231223 RepID=A0AAE0YLA2_9GAST|nr:hypothetical protein RRG08_052162 [Elysia crispata]
MTEYRRPCNPAESPPRCRLDGCAEGGLLRIGHVFNEFCPQNGGHMFEICFLTSKADDEAESDFDACLTWGSDNLNGSPVTTTVIWILVMERTNSESTCEV